MTEAVQPFRAAIRTPDHGLRVFVSSTLKELAEERKVVGAAFEDEYKLATPNTPRLIHVKETPEGRLALAKGDLAGAIERFEEGTG